MAARKAVDVSSPVIDLFKAKKNKSIIIKKYEVLIKKFLKLIEPTLNSGCIYSTRYFFNFLNTQARIDW